jgi:hypothetical protein
MDGMGMLHSCGRIIWKDKKQGSGVVTSDDIAWL